MLKRFQRHASWEQLYGMSWVSSSRPNWRWSSASSATLALTDWQNYKKIMVGSRPSNPRNNASVVVSLMFMRFMFIPHFIAMHRSRSLEMYIAVSCSIMSSYHGLGPKILSLNVNVVYVQGKIVASSVTCLTCLLRGKTNCRTPRV